MKLLWSNGGKSLIWQPLLSWETPNEFSITHPLIWLPFFFFSFQCKYLTLKKDYETNYRKWDVFLRTGSNISIECDLSVWTLSPWDFFIHAMLLEEVKISNPRELLLMGNKIQATPFSWEGWMVFLKDILKGGGKASVWKPVLLPEFISPPSKCRLGNLLAAVTSSSFAWFPLQKIRPL